LVTSKVSPSRRYSRQAFTPGLPASTPDRFSLKILSQPLSFSSWTAKSWPVELTLAYPEPLFRFYSPQIQLAQADLVVAMRAEGRAAKSEATRNVSGAIQRLRNLDVPDSRIDEVRNSLTNPRTIDWASPATGDIIEKKVIEGQGAGEKRHGEAS
jgi:Barrel-sandwich domain of CusB or HlyD membrane-fusion